MDLERSMGGSCDASGEASTPGPEKSYDSGNRAQSQRSAERIGGGLCRSLVSLARFSMTSMYPPSAGFNELHSDAFCLSRCSITKCD